MVATILMIFLISSSKNAILDCTFRLDSTFLLDSTLKVDRGVYAACSWAVATWRGQCVVGRRSVMNLVGRRCAGTWRRYLRPPRWLGFRAFLVSVAGVYFTAMYVFQASLERSPRRPSPAPRRWDAGGADDVMPPEPQQRDGRRRRLPDDRLDGDLQAAFDDIRRLDQERAARRGPGGEAPRRDDAGPPRPWPSPLPEPDASLPASCDASAAAELRRDDFRPLADAFLLSAFWDERPNDFDNRHNGTLVRLMAVARDAAARSLALHCDFGGGGGGGVRTRAAVYEMCENHGRPYGSFVLSCRVPDNVVDAPCFVTVVAETPTGDRSVDVPVRTLRPTTNSKRSFSVCVPPLFGDIPPARLVEFFEVTRYSCCSYMLLHFSKV